LQFGRGELGWGRRRRRRRNSEGRQLAELWYINICWWNHWRTHSVGGSVGNSNGELVMSLYTDLGESLGDSIGKIARKNFHISEPPFFFKKNLNILSVISSVYIDCIIPPIHTYLITDGIVSSSIYHRNVPIELFRWF
jgi:hypothetical protein